MKHRYFNYPFITVWVSLVSEGSSDLVNIRLVLSIAFFISIICALIFIISCHILDFGKVCSCSLKFFTYIIKTFICAPSDFLMQALRATVSLAELFLMCPRGFIVLCLHCHLVPGIILFLFLFHWPIHHSVMICFISISFCTIY